MAQPVIGLTLDHEPPGGYSKFPWYAIRENYCNAVRHAGGLPILLPHDPDAAAAYLDQIDGLIVTGGGFDVDPALFGATTRHPSVTTKDRRTAFELAAAKGALAEAGIEVADEREAVIVDLHNKPGAMGEIARDLADAGVSVDVAYTIFSGVRLVIVTEDTDKARAALDLNGASG